MALDGEVSDSTRTESFALAHPERFCECDAAEQQMLATAVGMQVRGWVPFAAAAGGCFNPWSWVVDRMCQTKCRQTSRGCRTPC